MAITTKRQAIATAIAGLPSVTFCPTTVKKATGTNQLPAVLVQFSSPAQRVTHTGGYTDNDWTFALDIIVNGVDENAAVESIESLVDDLLEMQREDPMFGGVFVDSRIEGSGEPRFERVDETSPPLLVMRMYLTGTTEEG